MLDPKIHNRKVPTPYLKKLWYIEMGGARGETLGEEREGISILLFGLMTFVLFYVFSFIISCLLHHNIKVVRSKFICYFLSLS